MEPQIVQAAPNYLMEAITILAIILGPILGIQIQKYLERRKEDKTRKNNIFKTLMSTRGANLTPAHIQALNLIDLEFHKDDKYEEVIDAWGEYLDNLKLAPAADASNEAFQIWSSKNEDLLATLLFKMGRSLGYKFDKVQIKRNSYTPKGTSEAEQEWNYIRKGLVQMIQTGVPVYNNTTEEEEKQQAELQELYKNYLSNPVPVKILNGEDTPPEEPPAEQE